MTVKAFSLLLIVVAWFTSCSALMSCVSENSPETMVVGAPLGESEIFSWTWVHVVFGVHVL